MPRRHDSNLNNRTWSSDVQGHIQVLRDCLDPKHPLYQPEQQHVNIKALIKLYEDKKLDGIQEVWLVEGKVVTEEEARNHTGWVWEEVCLFLFPFLPPPPKILASITTYLTNRLKL
jgi:hypothetical protein